MTNFQVYRKTLSFSFVNFLIGLISLALFGGCCVAGFFIGKNNGDYALLGLAIGFVVGVAISALISVFISNRIKSAQIAMMTKGVTEGNLPEHTFSEGMHQMKGRFGKITAFFFITNAIKGIFRQIGNGINKVGTMVGGDIGNGVTSAINQGVQTVVGYLCDCCLGWIFYRENINSFKAGCEGAVIFFKHGKTFARNVGRIFGMGLLSLVVIAGAFGGISYFIFTFFPDVFTNLGKEIANLRVKYGWNIPDFLTQNWTLMLVAAAFIGIIMWSIIHSLLIRPFILTGVLRNFMEAGIKDMPTQEDMDSLAQKSPRFAKLQKKI